MCVVLPFVVGARPIAVRAECAQALFGADDGEAVRPPYGPKMKGLSGRELFIRRSSQRRSPAIEAITRSAR
jgi:hypothetical protein